MRSKPDKVFQALDQEEEDLIQSIEKDEWTEVPDVARFKAQARQYAEVTIRKDRRMNIRISDRDLRNLKKKAMEEGIPYQTMVSMILHKYVTGRFLEQKPEDA